jgi:hypothetical protein
MFMLNTRFSASEWCHFYKITSLRIFIQMSWSNKLTGYTKNVNDMNTLIKKTQRLWSRKKKFRRANKFICITFGNLKCFTSLYISPFLMWNSQTCMTFWRTTLCFWKGNWHRTKLWRIVRDSYFMFSEEKCHLGDYCHAIQQFLCSA